VPAYFLRNVVLAAATTIGAEGRIDIRDNGGSALLDMGGFDLTKTGAGVLQLGLTSPLSNPGNFNVNAGTLLLEFGTDLGAPADKAINLAAGTTLNAFNLTTRQRWTVNAGAGTFFGNNQDSSVLRYDGAINLAGTTTIGNGLGTGRAYDFRGVIGGASGNLVLNNAGNVFFLANNTYGGTTTIASTSGNVYVGRNSVDGNVDGLATSTVGSLGAGAVTMSAGLLCFSRTDDIVVPNAITATGGALIGGATTWAVANRGGKVTFTGPVSLSGTATARTSPPARTPTRPPGSRPASSCRPPPAPSPSSATPPRT